MIKITQNGWLDALAACLPSPHFNQRPNRDDITTIVLHNISLPPLEFGREFVDALFLGNIQQFQKHHPFFGDIADLRVSAHFFIDRDGSLTQYVSTFDRAWHAGASQFQGRENCNDFSIGIELNGADHIPFTHRQYLSTANLILALARLHPNLSHLTTHSHIAPQRKTDPGPAFKHDYLRALLKKQSTNCYTATNPTTFSYHA